MNTFKNITLHKYIFVSVCTNQKLPQSLESARFTNIDSAALNTSVFMAFLLLF